MQSKDSCVQSHPQLRIVLCLFNIFDIFTGKVMVSFMCNKGNAPNTRHYNGIFSSSLAQEMCIHGIGL